MGGGFFVFRYIDYEKDRDPNKAFLIPHAIVSEVNVTNFSNEKVDLIAKLIINNPLPMNFTVDSLGYSVYMAGEKIAKSHYLKSFIVNRSSSKSITLPLVIFLHKLRTTAKSSERQELDSVEYELNANFYTNFTFGKKLNLNVKRVLPLIHPLELKIERAETDSLDLRHAKLLLHTVITNKNAFDITAKNINYRIAFGGNQWIDGTKEGPLNIAANNKITVILPLQISFKEVLKTVSLLIKDGKNIPYKLEGQLIVNIEKRNIKNCQVFIQNSGTLKEFINMIKKKKNKYDTK